MSASRAGAAQSAFACAGICALALAAPFETTAPLLQIPGQSFSSVEVVVVIGLVVWLGAAAMTGEWPAVRTPLLVPVAAVVAASLVAAVAASSHRGNALHMAGRLGIAGAVFALTVAGVTSPRRIDRVVLSLLASAVLVSLLMFFEYWGDARVLEFLRRFRPGVAVVGAQVRAGGPFQYPTIASMYLEIVFGLAVGLLPAAVRAGRRRRAVVLLVALAVIGEAIVLTFTRAGLVTMAASLAIVAGVARPGKFDAGFWALAAVAGLIVVEVFASRSIEAVRLRMTTETQDAWYATRIAAPARVVLSTGEMTAVPVTVTNTGRVTWQPEAVRPFRFSYHWLAADSDRVVVWEGVRTLFARPVAPGETVTLQAAVRAPGEPGSYRLVWDVEQQHQLWFSSETDSPLASTTATVTGPVVAPSSESTVRYLPRAAIRPGRLTLWRAAVGMFASHPLTGVGLDNYRLLYGGYAQLPGADPRVHSNNMYLEILAGTGIVGAVAAAWFGWRALRAFTAAAATHSAWGAGVLAAGLAITLHGIVDSFLTFTPTYLLMAIILGLSVAVNATDGAYADRV